MTIGTPFEEGNPGGPGRPKGSKSGRRAALDLLDKVLLAKMSKRETWEALEKDVDDKYGKNPLGFFLKVIVPLVPREILVEHVGEEMRAALHVFLETGNGKVKDEAKDEPKEGGSA